MSEPCPGCHLTSRCQCMPEFRHRSASVTERLTDALFFREKTGIRVLSIQFDGDEGYAVSYIDEQGGRQDRHIYDGRPCVLDHPAQLSCPA